MSTQTKFPLLVPVLLLTLASLARADVITQIGTQHFTDGQTGISTGTFTTAVAGQPAPFDNFYGSDPSGPNFSNSWTFAYNSLSGSTITGADVSARIYLLASNALAYSQRTRAFESDTIGQTSRASVRRIPAKQ